MPDGRLQLRLPDGDYRVEFFRPSDGTQVGKPTTHVTRGLRTQDPVALPPFADDLALRITRIVTRDQTAIPDSH